MSTTGQSASAIRMLDALILDAPLSFMAHLRDMEHQPDMVLTLVYGDSREHGTMATTFLPSDYSESQIIYGRSHLSHPNGNCTWKEVGSFHAVSRAQLTTTTTAKNHTSASQRQYEKLTLTTSEEMDCQYLSGRVWYRL